MSDAGPEEACPVDRAAREHSAVVPGSTGQALITVEGDGRTRMFDVTGRVIYDSGEGQ